MNLDQYHLNLSLINNKNEHCYLYYFMLEFFSSTEWVGVGLSRTAPKTEAQVELLCCYAANQE